MVNHRFKLCVQGNTQAAGYISTYYGRIYKEVQVCGHETVSKKQTWNLNILPVTTDNGDYDLTNNAGTFT